MIVTLRFEVTPDPPEHIDNPAPGRWMHVESDDPFCNRWFALDDEFAAETVADTVLRNFGAESCHSR